MGLKGIGLLGKQSEAKEQGSLVFVEALKGNPKNRIPVWGPTPPKKKKYCG